MTCKLIESRRVVLVSPTFALRELHKYSNRICKKSHIEITTFQEKLEHLKNIVFFLDPKSYKLVNVPDKNDIDFLSLAAEQQIPLWSNDKKLKEQDSVEVINTAEVLDLLKFP